jgi:hypothetical protein
VNVTFQCIFNDENNQQTTTQWAIRNFGNFTKTYDILTPVPSAIQEGTPSEGLFGSHREQLTFPEYADDINGATLYCGNFPILFALFHLRVYSKFRIMPKLHQFLLP